MACLCRLWFLLFLLVSPCTCYLFDNFPNKHIPRPWMILVDENPHYFDEVHPQRMRAPKISIDEQQITSTMANIDGFKITSAILEQQSLTPFLKVDLLFKERNGTKVIIPYCDGISVYVHRLENEKEILDKNPGIIDGLRSGLRNVETKVDKRIDKFNGGGNVSVSHPFVYFKEGVAVHGADGFDRLLEFEDEGESESKKKIEMVIVANIVLFQGNCDVDRDSLEWHELSMFDSDLEGEITRCKQMKKPFGITMLYSLQY